MAENKKHFVEISGTAWDQAKKECSTYEEKKSCIEDGSTEIIKNVNPNLKCDWSAYALKVDGDKIKVEKKAAIKSIGTRIKEAAQKASSKITGSEAPEEAQKEHCYVKTIPNHQDVRIS